MGPALGRTFQPGPQKRDPRRNSGMDHGLSGLFLGPGGGSPGPGWQPGRIFLRPHPGAGLPCRAHDTGTWRQAVMTQSEAGERIQIVRHNGQKIVELKFGRRNVADSESLIYEYAFLLSTLR